MDKMINFLKQDNHIRIIKILDSFTNIEKIIDSKTKKEEDKTYNYEIYEYLEFTL